MEKNTNTIETVNLLMAAAKADTIYRDVYLRRAREVLRPTLDEPGYRAIGSTQKEIDELVHRARSALLQRNWEEAAEVSAQADHLRQTMAAMGHLAGIGKDVYEAEVVAFDPFSRGKHLGPQSQANQPVLRTQLLDTFASLGKNDSGLGAFYEKRRSYFSGLEVASTALPENSQQRDSAQVEQLALEAAERGDVAALRELAKQLRDRKEHGAAEISEGASALKGRYECPVNLDIPFAPDVGARARELGFAEAHVAAAIPEMRAAVEVIYTHAWKTSPSTPDMEREGALRCEGGHEGWQGAGRDERVDPLRHRRREGGDVGPAARAAGEAVEEVHHRVARALRLGVPGREVHRCGARRAVAERRPA